MCKNAGFQKLLQHSDRCIGGFTGLNRVLSALVSGLMSFRKPGHVYQNSQLLLAHFVSLHELVKVTFERMLAFKYCCY